MIKKRLSALSWNEEEYEKVKPLYETELNESGYKIVMTFTKTSITINRNRARNMTWFKANMRKYFSIQLKKTFSKKS